LQLDQAQKEVEEYEKQLLAKAKEIVLLQEKGETARQQASATAAELAAALSASAKSSAERREIAVRVTALEEQLAASERARASADQRSAHLQQELELLTNDSKALKVLDLFHFLEVSHECLLVEANHRDADEARMQHVGRLIEVNCGLKQSTSILDR
jgi:chromosome segregation ATPase